MMKRALSVAAVTALSLLVFLFVGYAQEEGAEAVSELLEHQLASMESAFGGLEAFMSELISEVKGNMADIDDLYANLNDLEDVVKAVTIELKDAEGKIVGLREDTDSLSDVQQELKVRIVALEAGLSELSAFCEELKVRLDGAETNLASLRGDFDALFARYATFQEEYAAFKDSVYADISLLQRRVEDLSTRVLALEDEDVGTFKKKVIELERTMAAVAIRVDNNRTKLEGFDYTIAGLAEEMAATREGILRSNEELLSEYEVRLQALEESDLATRVDTVFFISIVALLAGVGALIWGFLGNQ
jgi:chromosome segregation ATPase